MRRILFVLTSLAVAAAGCGSDTTTTATPDGAERDAPARIAEPAPTTTADPCAPLRAVLEDLDAIREAGDDVYATRLTEALDPIDTDAAVSISTLVELDGRPEHDEQALALIESLDTISYAACGIPAVSAGIILAGQSGPVFCPVGEAIDGDGTNLGTPEEPCPPPPPPLPTVLPCFEATGVAFQLDPLGAYEAVDCESGDPVRWDADRDVWVADDRAAIEQKFEEVDRAIG